jgi:phosphatidylglycerophosphate synthase
VELDAIVLADTPKASVRIAGLSARDRAVRVAERAGAARVFVITGERAALVGWRAGRTCPVLVIRADQLVHPPLVAPLVMEAMSGDDVVIAVDPVTDDYAGALLATGPAGDRVVEAIAGGEADAAIARTATRRIPHGDIARHAITTADDQRGAHAMLYRLLVKPQDNVITRYLFRPVSSRISRVLVWTPLTATHVSLVVAALVAFGCWMTLDPDPRMMIGGTFVILFASYLDCCDGEIARLKLQSSTFGAWLDTVVDELSSIGYMVAIGWHCHVYYGPTYFGDLGFDPWLVGIGVGLVTFTIPLVGIYYNIIVAVGSANSQDYTGRFILVEGSRPGSLRLAPKPGTAIALPRWLVPIAEFLPNIVRRDFIVWLVAFYAVLRIPHVSFVTHLVGGIVSSIVVTLDHLHLRGLLRRARHEGKSVERVRG